MTRIYTWVHLGLELRFSLTLKLILRPLAHPARKCSTNWRRRGGDSPVVFDPSPLPTPSPYGLCIFYSPGPAAAREEGVCQSGDRWEMLAPRNSSMPALLLPDCFPPLFLELTFLSTTHLCRKQPGCLQGVGKLPAPTASGSLLLPLSNMGRRTRFPPCKRADVGWGGEFVFSLGGFDMHMLVCCLTLFSCLPPRRRAAIMPMFIYVYTPLFCILEPQNVKTLSW